MILYARFATSGLLLKKEYTIEAAADRITDLFSYERINSQREGIISLNSSCVVRVKLVSISVSSIENIFAVCRLADRIGSVIVTFVLSSNESGGITGDTNRTMEFKRFSVDFL